MNRITSAATSFMGFPRRVASRIRSLHSRTPAASPATASVAPPRKKRVLLVDDEAALTMLCRLMLEKTDNFIVAEESHGCRVLETARKFRPDVIFLDLSLPDKDGRAIASELQADPALRQVPIVFWSGSLHPHNEMVSSAHGCWPAMSKPFSSGKLAALAANPNA